jgi:DNA-binding transcriptional MerR regulator
MNPMSSQTNGKALKLKKLFYSIGEVSELTGIPAHVLRYWEGEFSELSPKKGRNGSRLYQERDLILIRRIMSLLYDQKFTISGARKRLKEERSPASGANGSGELMKDIRQELRGILKLMDK